MNLIDKDALIEELKRCASSYYPITSSLIEGIIAGFRKAIVQVEHAPTIEAEPVRRGKWHRTFVDGFNRWHFVYDCSECGIRTETTTKYCPNCGAKMDGKKEEEKE